MNGKRLLIATLSGVLFGLVCFGMASSGGDLAWPLGVQIILSRTLIGFAIGISACKKMHWTLHGFFLGIIFSLALAFGGLMAPENPDFSNNAIFVSTIVMGGIYGLLIELITSVVFKAKANQE